MTTYYVDSSAAGSDSFNGTTTSTPWKTLSKVTNATLAAGDQVLFKKGATWTGEALFITQNGTSASRIVFGAYGTGANPVFNGNALKTPIACGGNFVTIQDITCTNAGDDEKVGIGVFATDVLVQRVWVYHCALGVQVYQGGDRCRITASNISDNDVLLAGPGSNDDYGGQGITVLAVDGVQIDNNQLNRNICRSLDYYEDGSAIEVFGATNMVVFNNFADGNQTFTELGEAATKGCLYYNNVITGSHDYQIGFNLNGVGDYGPLGGTTFIYNNTVNLTGAGAVAIYVGAQTPASVHNNIFAGTDVSSTFAYKVDEGHNVWYGASASSVWSTANSGNGIAPTSVVANPQFVSSTNMALQSTSPAINRGSSNYGHTLDIAGNTRPSTNVDAGAYEFGSAGGTTAATLSVSASTLTFASTTVGSSAATQTFTVTNTGTATATGLAVSISGDYSRTTTLGASLAANASGTVTVTFTPTAAGTRTGTVTITSSASNTPTVALTGTATAAGSTTTYTGYGKGTYGHSAYGRMDPVTSGGGTTPPTGTGYLTVNPATYTYSNVSAAGATQNFTATNTGDGPISNLTVSFTGAAAADYTVQTGSTTLGSTLAVGAQATLTVKFLPSVAGIRNAVLVLTGTSMTNSPLQVPLTGTSTLSSGGGGTPTTPAAGTYGAAAYGSGIYGTTVPATGGGGDTGGGDTGGTGGGGSGGVALFAGGNSPNRNPLHLCGIGPWNATKAFRGAVNYGIGKGIMPARPIMALPQVQSRGFTLRLNDSCEARAELTMPRTDAIIIEEMATDLWWRRKDPVTAVLDMIGRFNCSSNEMARADDGTLTSSLQFVDYRTLLGERLVLKYKDATHAENLWNTGTAVTDIMRFAVPTNMAIDLSAIQTGGTDLGAITTPYTLDPSSSIADMFTGLLAISPKAWEWWIDIPSDVTLPPKLKFVVGTRGTNRGVILFDYGVGATPISSWTMRATSDTYANAIYYSGDSGGVVTTIASEITEYGERDTTAGNASLGGDITLITKHARTKLLELSDRRPTFTLSLRPGFWKGRTHIDIGDTVRVVIKLGDELMDFFYRVTEIQVDVNDNDSEQVTLTVGSPLPSANPRSRNAPLTKVIRTLKTYVPPAGSPATFDD